MFIPRHRHFHALSLGLVITSANSTLSPTVIYLPISPTDHFPIILTTKRTPLLTICSLKITNSLTAPIKISHSCYTCHNHYLCHDFLFSCLITHPPSTPLIPSSFKTSPAPQIKHILLTLRALRNVYSLTYLFTY